MTHHTTEQAPGDELAATTPPEPATRLQETIATVKSARRRRRTVFIAAAAALALVAGTVGAVAWAKANTAHHLEVLQAQVQAALDANEAAVTRLDALLDLAEETHTGSEGKVVDDEVRVALAEAITTASNVPLSADFQVASGESFDDARGALVITGDIATTVQQVTDDLAAATTTVREAQDAWELEQAGAALDTALGALSASIDSATATFTSSQGKDLDQGALQALTDEINAATGARDTTIDRTLLEPVQAATAVLADHKATLDAAAQIIVEAQAAWQGEQERIAAEQRAAAQRPATSGQGQKAASSKSAPSKAGSSSSSNTGTKTAPKASSPKTSTPKGTAPAAPPATNGGGTGGGGTSGGGWVEDFDSYDWCGDSQGNSWQC